MLLRVLLALERGELQQTLEASLADADHAVETVDAAALLAREVAPAPCDAVLIHRFSLGRALTRRVRQLRQLPDDPLVIVLTDEEDSRARTRLLAAGCTAVLNTEVGGDMLTGAMLTMLENRRRTAQSSLAAPRVLGEPSLDDFVSESPVMKEFLRVARRVARSDSSVLILGETGVGKERLAHALHAEGARAEGPFIPVNCAALPETLLESELFGHEEGAFTGAIRSRRGCFELAHGGTLFLDEIGELPAHLQVKLLRALENQQLQRIGSEKPIPVDVRVMAATNRDVEAAVQSQALRRDLFYRLNVVSLTIPPLRERAADIPELVHCYLQYLGPRIGCGIPDIQDAALACLCEYDWPGNVRELINVIERAILLCDEGVITPADLPSAISHLPEIQVESSPGLENGRAVVIMPDNWLALPLKELRHLLSEQLERRYLQAQLELARGRVGAAATRAGIDERTLFEKMRHYGLRKEDFR